MGCDILCNIDLEQVIHLSEAHDSKLTVVYKRVPRSMVTPGNALLDVTDEDRVLSVSSGSVPEGDNL